MAVDAAPIEPVSLAWASVRTADADVFAYAAMLGIDLIASHRTAIEEALASDHQAILNAYLARHTPTAPSKHLPVFAPPELQDDDIPDKDSCA